MQVTVKQTWLLQDKDRLFNPFFALRMISNLSIVQQSSFEFDCREKLVIAPFGFDKTTWDPTSDNSLAQSYSADDMKGKTMCKVALQQTLDLKEGASKILVGFSANKTVSFLGYLLEALTYNMSCQQQSHYVSYLFHSLF